MGGGRLREVVAHGGSIDDNTVPTPGYIFFFFFRSLYTVDSLLTDTFLKRTPRVCPSFLYSLYLTLYKTDISLRRTLTAGPKGVRLRGSWLYTFHCDTCISSYIRLAFSRTIYGLFLIAAFINGFEEIWFKFDEMTTYMFSMYNFCKVGCGWRGCSYYQHAWR